MELGSLFTETTYNDWNEKMLSLFLKHIQHIDKCHPLKYKM